MYYLIAYWLIFWRDKLKNPYQLCTSEIASTYFPFWLWMGKSWQPTDDIYYKYPACIPFLSMFYLPSVIASKLTRFLTIDAAFRIYAYFILAHYLLASFIAYKVLGLFGALTLTYAGYCIKPQTPAFVYTMCWMPGMIITGNPGALCCCMAILGGYWPILVYFLPIAIFINPTCLWGVLIASPQIIMFLLYWKKSVRSGQKVERNFGKIPWYKLKDLFIPSNSVSLVNGVHYPEAEIYMGIAIFMIHIEANFQSFFFLLFLLLGIFVSIGYVRPFQRIPSRALYLLTFCIASLVHQENLSIYLIVLQGYMLLRNSSVYPSFPFSQWWKRPSELYVGDRDVCKWPFQSGYLFNDKVPQYVGGFSLK